MGCDFLTLFSLITHLYEVLGSNSQYILKEESEASILTFGLRLFDPALFITGMKCEQENISTSFDYSELDLMWMCGKWPQLTLDSWIIIPDWDFELSKVIWLHQTHLSPPCEHIHSAWTRWWWASLMSWFLLTMIKWKYKKKDENKNAGKKRRRQSRETTREVKNLLWLEE